MFVLTLFKSPKLAMVYHLCCLFVNAFVALVKAFIVGQKAFLNFF